MDIIVATRNRHQDLEKFVPTVLAQRDANFRLIVVDQSDDPEPNLEKLRSLADPRIVHVIQRAKGKSKALNLGLNHATQPLLAFTDDDCTLPADWLKRGAESFDTHPDAGIVFGSVVAAEHDWQRFFVPSLDITELRVVRGRPFRPLGPVGMGANMFVRRSVFERIGRFDEDLGPGGPLFTGEESELTYRALRHGIEVVREPALSVKHWGMRPYSGAAARKLIREAYYASGAGHGKHLRDGDLSAATILIYETAQLACATARAVVTGARPPMVRLGLLWKGAVAGFSRGPSYPTPNGYAS
jgi:glycosyltransferase involved in cell wall biosynthesis